MLSFRLYHSIQGALDFAYDPSHLFSASLSILKALHYPIAHLPMPETATTSHKVFKGVDSCLHYNWQPLPEERMFWYDNCPYCRRPHWAPSKMARTEASSFFTGSTVSLPRHAQRLSHHLSNSNRTSTASGPWLTTTWPKLRSKLSMPLLSSAQQHRRGKSAANIQQRAQRQSREPSSYIRQTSTACGTADLSSLVPDYLVEPPSYQAATAIDWKAHFKCLRLNTKSPYPAVTSSVDTPSSPKGSAWEMAAARRWSR